MYKDVSMPAYTDLDFAGNQSYPIAFQPLYRSDQIYSGNATALAPDLIIGYKRGYRASWDTVEGTLADEIITTNTGSWSGDHCMDALEVPGVLFSNRQIRAQSPSLVDVAPSILAEFKLGTPSSMVGKNIFSG